MPANAWAIVVAGGDGRRFGAPKQFELLAGRRVVEWAVESARAVVDEVVLVLPADRLDDEALRCGCTHVVAGGTTRSESVRAGIRVVPLHIERIVIHDAARPLATPSLFAAVLGALACGADAAVPAVTISDTIKRVSGDLVVETLERSELVAAQTPQAFTGEALRRAHSGNPEATDDAALVEALGYKVVIVPGELENKKLTELADLSELSQSLSNRKLSRGEF